MCKKVSDCDETYFIHAQLKKTCPVYTYGNLNQNTLQGYIKKNRDICSFLDISQQINMYVNDMSGKTFTCPMQVFPPKAGAGFPHVLLLCLTPKSHVFEHALQSDQDVH